MAIVDDRQPGVVVYKNNPDKPQTAVLISVCFQCKKRYIYEMDEQETELLEEYQKKGRKMGYKHKLFPNVPVWMIADCLEPYYEKGLKCPACRNYKKPKK